MKKTAYLFGITALMAGMAHATLIEFSNLNGDATHSGVTVDAIGGPEIVTRAVDGDDLVFSFSITNKNLDDGGVNNDSMSWDVRFEAFLSSVNLDQVTLGSGVIATNDNTEFNPIDDTWNANQSIKFTVENVNLTADPGYAATFNGFSAMWVTPGSYYVGTGAGTTSITATNSPGGNISFGPVTELVLTVQATERNRNLDGSFTVAAIPEPSSLALFGAGALYMLYSRRKRG